MISTPAMVFCLSGSPLSHEASCPRPEPVSFGDPRNHLAAGQRNVASTHTSVAWVFHFARPGDWAPCQSPCLVSLAAQFSVCGRLPSRLHPLGHQLSCYAEFAAGLAVSFSRRPRFIPNTELRGSAPLPAESTALDASKGLDRDGYKPLMRNRTGTSPSPIGYPAGNIFPRSRFLKSPASGATLPLPLCPTDRATHDSAVTAGFLLPAGVAPWSELRQTMAPRTRRPASIFTP